LNIGTNATHLKQPVDPRRANVSSKRLAFAATSFAFCQAKSAILFLYREVLRAPLEWLGNVTTAKSPERLPVVLTRSETQHVLLEIRLMSPTYRQVASLLYGAELRLLEALRLHVKDVDFGRHEFLVLEGKGAKDRVTMLRALVEQALRLHLDKVNSIRGDTGLIPFTLPRAHVAHAKS
jgi:site-specific recombinase XerD